jgi:hypothetical protein
MYCDVTNRNITTVCYGGRADTLCFHGRLIWLPLVMRQTSRQYYNSSHTLFKKVSCSINNPLVKLLKVRWRGCYVHIIFIIELLFLSSLSSLITRLVFLVYLDFCMCYLSFFFHATVKLVFVKSVHKWMSTWCCYRGSQTVGRASLAGVVVSHEVRVMCMR